MKFLSIVIFACGLLLGQPSSYPLLAGPPPPVQIGSASRVGGAGNQTYAYFVVARYLIGNALRSPAITIINAPATLTVSNFITVSWTAQSNATGYDLLRLTGTTTFPSSGTCTNCLIASNTTSTAVNDQSNTTLGNYTLTSAPGASATEFLDNVTQPLPTITHDSPSPTTERWTQNVGLDASGARITRPAKVVTSLPATCASGEQYFLSTASPGSQLYLCGPPNTLTQVVGGGGGGSGVNCLPITTMGVVAVNFATAGLAGIACTDIQITLSGNITGFSLSGATSSRLSVTFIQGVVGFTVAGLAGNLLNWCPVSSTANKYTIQNILFDGTNYNGDGCSSNDPTIVPVTQGGTGFGSYTKGDLLCAQNTTTLIKLPIAADGQVLTASAAATCGLNWAAASSGFNTLDSTVSTGWDDFLNNGVGTVDSGVNANIGQYQWGKCTSTGGERSYWIPSEVTHPGIFRLKEVAGGGNNTALCLPGTSANPTGQFAGFNVIPAGAGGSYEYHYIVRPQIFAGGEEYDIGLGTQRAGPIGAIDNIYVRALQGTDTNWSFVTCAASMCSVAVASTTPIVINQWATIVLKSTVSGTWTATITQNGTTSTVTQNTNIPSAAIGPVIGCVSATGACTLDVDLFSYKITGLVR